MTVIIPCLENAADIKERKYVIIQRYGLGNGMCLMLKANGIRVFNQSEPGSMHVPYYPEHDLLRFEVYYSR